MKNLISLCLYLTVSTYCSFAQPPTISWAHCYGGTENDYGSKVINGTDNDLIVVGYTYSNNIDIHINFDSINIYWFRLDTNGVIISSHGFGGNGIDYSVSVVTAWDSGYVILGNTTSNDGDVSGNHGKYDIWIIKINNQGVLQWSKCYGGSNNDIGFSLSKTSDSSYIISGQTSSVDGDVSINHSLPNASDFWILKIDFSGNIMMEKTYGGPNDEFAYDIFETQDKGFLITGGTFSDSGQVSGNHGSEDFWIVKTDSIGNLLWQHCYGGSSLDEAYKTLEINSIYYLVGMNSSDDGDVSNNHLNGSTPSGDVWLIAIDSSGAILWEKSLGGYDSEWGKNLCLKNNYLFLGCSSSSVDGDVSNNHNHTADYWIVQLDLQGNLLFENCYGGSDLDYLSTILLDNNYLYAIGNARSTSGNVTGNRGAADIWLFKLNITGIINQINNDVSNVGIEIFPNPASNYFHIKTKEETDFILESLEGKILRKREIRTFYSENIEELPDGIYLIKLISNKSNLYSKLLVVQH